MLFLATPAAQAWGIQETANGTLHTAACSGCRGGERLRSNRTWPLLDGYWCADAGDTEVTCIERWLHGLLPASYLGVLDLAGEGPLSLCSQVQSELMLGTGW